MQEPMSSIQIDEIDDCEIIESGTTGNKTPTKAAKKKKKEKQTKLTLEEKLYSIQITSLMSLLPIDAKYSIHPSAISLFQKKALQILQTNSGLYFFKFPFPKYLYSLPPSEIPIIIPSSGYKRNFSQELFLAVWPNQKKFSSTIFAIVCPKSQKVIRKFFTDDKLYSGSTLSFSSGRGVSYLTSQLSVTTISAAASLRVERPLGLILQAYLDAALKADALDSLKFEGLLVDHAHGAELLVLWGRWVQAPFVAVFYKKLMHLKLAVFDLLSAFQTSVTKIQVVPSHHFRKAETASSAGRDKEISEVYLAVFSVSKVAVYRLREMAENRFADPTAPCYTLDHMVTSGLN